MKGRARRTRSRAEADKTEETAEASPLAQSLQRLERTKRQHQVVAISGLCRGSFWNDFSRGLRREAEAADADVIFLVSQSVHEPTGRALVEGFARPGRLFVFNSGPLDKNSVLIQSLLARGASVVTSGFHVPFAGTCALSLDDVGIGCALAESVHADLGERSRARVLCLIPKEPFDWIPVILRYEAWRRKFKELRPDALVTRVVLAADGSPHIDAVRKVEEKLRGARESQYHAIVTFFGDVALGAADAVREAVSPPRSGRSAARGPACPRVYGVDITTDVIQSMVAPRGVEMWRVVFGVDTVRYGREVLRAGLSLLRGEPPEIAPPAIESISPPELIERSIKTVEELAISRGWGGELAEESLRPRASRIGSRRSPQDLDFAGVKLSLGLGELHCTGSELCQPVDPVSKLAVLAALFAAEGRVVSHRLLGTICRHADVGEAVRVVRDQEALGDDLSKAADVLDGDAPPRGNLYNFKSDLNRELKPFKISIKNRRSEGYQLVEGLQPESTRRKRNGAARGPRPHRRQGSAGSARLV